MSLTCPPCESGRLEFGYHVRIETLVWAMAAAGIEGAERLRNTPAGWIGIFEALAAHLAQYPRNYSISEAKEKFGALYLEVIDTSSGRRATEVVQWCADQSIKRCMVFGTRGRIRSELGWIMTFSDAALDLLTETPIERFLSYVYLGPDWPMGKDDVIEMIAPRFATRAAAYEWYRFEPLPGFDGLTAMQLVQGGKARQVIDYISAIDAGTSS